MTHLDSDDFFAAPPNVIELPDDNEEVPLKNTGRRGRASGRRTVISQEPQSTLASGAVVPRSGDPARANVSFANPLSTDHPSRSTAQAFVAPV